VDGYDTLATMTIPIHRGNAPEKGSAIYSLHRHLQTGEYALATYRLARGNRPRVYAVYQELSPALQCYWNDVRSVIKAQNVENFTPTKVRGKEPTPMPHYDGFEAETA